MEDPPAVIALLFLVSLSGFFSLTGAALRLARKPRLRLKPALSRAEGKNLSAALLEAAENPESLIASLRIWNLLDRLAAGALAWNLFPGGSSPVLAALGAGGAVFIAFIVFSELLPRLLAQRNPEGILIVLFPLLSVLALPWRTLYTLAAGLPFFKGRPGDQGEEEFLLALEEGEKTGAVERDERSMVEGVLYLGDRPVSAFMTHRADIEWLDLDAGLEEVRRKVLRFRAQGFFPVVRGTQDNIAGVVPVQDILIALMEPWKGLGGIMKKPRFIPETLSAIKAFEAFKREDEEYLCVMDEYGGFAGSLRIRDLIEEIVGELTPSPEEDAVIRQEDGTWLAGGSVHLDDLAKMEGLEGLGPETSGGKTGAKNRDYHTLAGFILKLAGEIPRAGETLGWGTFRFQVLDLDGNRIDKVRIVKTENP
ncbi:MAG: hemolysin family protein [Treponema sp.]|jgi:putative hemolysin|nr:hemolysin family protein [Treponema sp.]